MITAITCLITSIVFTLYCLLYPYSGEPALSPMLVPFIASVVMLIASIGLVFHAYKAPKKAANVSITAPLLMLILIITYSLLLAKLHFILLSTLLVLVLMYAFGERRPTYLAIFPIGSSLGIYLIFVHLLGVLMP